MKIPTKQEIRLALQERKKVDKKKDIARAKKSIEEISLQMLKGKSEITAKVGSPGTVDYILKTFRNRGYNVEAETKQYRGRKPEDASKGTLFRFDFSEFED